RMTPVSSSAAPNARAAFTASWPAMASTTNRRSAEPTAASMSRTSAMRLSSTCSRPAVSTISASNTPLRARSDAARAIPAGASAAAHQLNQLGVQNADERLPRRQAREHLRAERLGPDRLDECLHHRQRHVRLQQRYARLAQRRGDVLVGDTAAAAQILDGAR